MEEGEYVPEGLGKSAKVQPTKCVDRHGFAETTRMTLGHWVAHMGLAVADKGLGGCAPHRNHVFVNLQWVEAVSYTHLTLPTTLRVDLSVVALLAIIITDS